MSLQTSCFLSTLYLTVCFALQPPAALRFRQEQASLAASPSGSFGANLHGNVNGGLPIKVNVYYESRCPDSKAFITNQLYPAYQYLGDSGLSINFVPFGKAIVVPTPWGYNDYVCHHGAAECLGNNLQACFLETQAKSLPQNTTVSFIYCQMASSKYPGDSVRECGDAFGIDWKSLEKCAYDRRVYPTYMDMMASKTFQVQKNVKGVPFITINGIQNDEAVNSNNFLKYICDTLQTASKPTICN